MAKNFWFKFDWDDWLNDEALSGCSLETQGLWLRCICFMYRGEAFELTGTIEQLRRKLGVLPEELTRCLHELKTNNVADVRFCNGDVSIISRRRQRDLKYKENNRLYVARHREKGECKTNVSIQSKSKSKNKIREEDKSDAEASENRAQKPSQISNDEWLATLKNEPLYSHVDIDREYRKATLWIEDHPNRRLTKTFFKNWINKIEPPLKPANGRVAMSEEEARGRAALLASQEAYYGRI